MNILAVAQSPGWMSSLYKFNKAANSSMREDRGAVGVGPSLTWLDLLKVPMVSARREPRIAHRRKPQTQSVPSSTVSHQGERGGRHFSEFSSRQPAPVRLWPPPPGGVLSDVFLRSIRCISMTRQAGAEGGGGAGRVRGRDNRVKTESSMRRCVQG